MAAWLGVQNFQPHGNTTKYPHAELCDHGSFLGDLDDPIPDANLASADLQRARNENRHLHVLCELGLSHRLLNRCHMGLRSFRLTPKMCQMHPPNNPMKAEKTPAGASWHWRLVRWVLSLLSRLHRKNWGKEYPQTWYCWPRWASRRNPRIYAVRTMICGALTGHELSKTEWGYGGGKFVDRHCRWCDNVIRVPKTEEDIPHPAMNDAADALGFFT